MPKTVQVFQSHRCAAFVVHGNRTGQFKLHFAARHNGRHLTLRQIRQHLNVGNQPIRDDDESFYAPVQQHFQVSFEAMRFIVRVRQQR